MRKFGLIGKSLTHSFSPTYFKNKFEREQIIDAHYELFPLENIEEINALKKEQENLIGLNVTIPYKESIIPFLDEISEQAQAIGAVNTIACLADGRWKGYNTDAFGFEKAIQTFVDLKTRKALVLGTGGASKAVQYILTKHAVPFYLLSRSPKKDSKEIAYEELNQNMLESHTLIINCTPLGTFPNINECPNIPFEFIGDKHFVFDLVYNPAETTLMKKAKAAGAKVANGTSMLENQAEASWEIWNK
jgi:shikimate dehydrogenase